MVLMALGKHLEIGKHSPSFLIPHKKKKKTGYTSGQYQSFGKIQKIVINMSEFLLIQLKRRSLENKTLQRHNFPSIFFPHKIPTHLTWKVSTCWKLLCFFFASWLQEKNYHHLEWLLQLEIKAICPCVKMYDNCFDIIMWRVENPQAINLSRGEPTTVQNTFLNCPIKLNCDKESLYHCHLLSISATRKKNTWRFSFFDIKLQDTAMGKLPQIANKFERDRP